MFQKITKHCANYASYDVHRTPLGPRGMFGPKWPTAPQWPTSNTQKTPKNGRIWEKMHCEISELPKGCPRKKLALEIFSPWARPKKAQNVGNTGPLGQILDLLGMCAILGL